MALSGAFETTITGDSKLRVEWSGYQNVVANRTYVTFTFYILAKKLACKTNDDLAFTVTSDGITTNKIYSSGRTNIDFSSITKCYLLTTEKFYVYHQSDGTGSMSFSLTLTYKSGLFNWGTSTCTLSGTLYPTTIDQVAPVCTASIVSKSPITADLKITSSYPADLMYYLMDHESYYISEDENVYSKTYTITGLSPGTNYSIQCRCKREYNQRYSSFVDLSFRTYDIARIVSLTDLEIDTANPYLVIRINPETVTNMKFRVSIKKGSTTYYTSTDFTLSQTGEQDLTFNLTSVKANILNSFPNSTSDTFTVILASYYNGTYCGEVSGTMKMKTTYANSGPSISGLTYYDGNGSVTSITGNNTYIVQSKSLLYVVPGTATARNGATIAKYTATIGSISNYNTTGEPIYLGPIASAPVAVVSLTVTDSRGYNGAYGHGISWVPYTGITLSGISVRRANDVDQEIQLGFMGSFSPVTVVGTNKNNLVSAVLAYKKTNESTFTNIDLTPNVTISNITNFSYSNLAAVLFDTNYSYDVELRLTDRLSSYIYYTTISQGIPLVALRKNKVGINKTEPNYTLDVGGSINATGTIYGTNVSSSYVYGNTSVYMRSYPVMGNQGSLSTTDLNNKTTGGIYYQATSSYATTARNYPVASAIGILEVIPMYGYTRLIQRYTLADGSAVYQRLRIDSSTWTVWKKFTMT